MNHNIYIYILITVGVTYLIRVIPMTVLRREIKSQFLKSFLYYVPYITLAVMTFPAIIHSTQSIWSGIAALVVGIAVAWFTSNLFWVAGSACAVVFIAELILF